MLGCGEMGRTEKLRTGHHGLAILAFLKHDAGALNGPHAEAIRGLDYLVRQQNAEGGLASCAAERRTTKDGTLACSKRAPARRMRNGNRRRSED